jgi:DNA-binding PucR family transcriptional regulator
VAAAAVLPAEGGAELLDAVRRRLPARGAAAWPAGGILLAAGTGPAALAGLVAAELPRAGGAGAVAGVGDAAPALEEAHASAREAQVAAWAAARLPGAGPVAVHAALGPLALLAAVARDHPDAAAREPPALAAIRAAPDGAELAATLLAFLDAGGDAGRAADDLHVHRATLYRRLRRAEQLGGLDLADGRRRLELHNALLLARLRG